MNDLEFIPAWYTRMLRRRRVVLIGTVGAVITAIAAIALRS